MSAKMMLALKGKLTFNQSTVSVSKNVDSSYQDVINSLVEMGYDKKNNALRYTRQTTGKKIYRIPLSTDYRIFVSIALFLAILMISFFSLLLSGITFRF